MPPTRNVCTDADAALMRMCLTRMCLCTNPIMKAGVPLSFLCVCFCYGRLGKTCVKVGCQQRWHRSCRGALLWLWRDCGCKMIGVRVFSKYSVTADMEQEHTHTLRKKQKCSPSECVYISVRLSDAHSNLCAHLSSVQLLLFCLYTRKRIVKNANLFGNLSYFCMPPVLNVLIQPQIGALTMQIGTAARMFPRIDQDRPPLEGRRPRSVVWRSMNNCHFMCKVRTAHFG